MTSEDAWAILSLLDEGEAIGQADARWALETLAGMKTEAQYHRNYETGRYERHTRIVGEWVKNDD